MKPGEIFFVDNVNDFSVIDRFIVTEVWKTGEKAKKVYRGRKPQGFNIYKNGVFYEFLPYGEKPKFLVQKAGEV